MRTPISFCGSEVNVGPPWSPRAMKERLQNVRRPTKLACWKTSDSALLDAGGHSPGPARCGAWESLPHRMCLPPEWTTVRPDVARPVEPRRLRVHSQRREPRRFPVKVEAAAREPVDPGSRRECPG